MATKYDYVLVGGGLQSALLVLGLRALQPGCRVALVEKDTRLGGNHTWCFHSGDVSGAVRTWIEPLVRKRWPAYSVRFTGFERRIEREYAAIASERLHTVVLDALQPGSDAHLGHEATRVAENEVELADGTRLLGRVVVDARGPRPHTNQTTPSTHGFQKFLGLELETTVQHGIDVPMLMDATVDQGEGFHFVYSLPFTPTRLLVEDTFFADRSALDREACRSRILDYVAARGIAVASVVREEEGVLPMPWRDDFDAPPRGPLRAGYRGGFFHPATGYSLPVAARLAEHVASRPPARLFDDALLAFARRHRRQAVFCHRLNSMLFQWFPPERRWHVFRRFYGLPVETIERFYALRLRTLDQGRLLLGRPPRGMSVRYRISKGAQR